MQKAIAKYGLAAHLALVAVAPLFLFPFFGDVAVAKALLWLSLPAAFWVVLEPSVRRGEMPHDARRRVARSIVHDPLFWTFLVVAAVAGFRALNTGIALAYDYETRTWDVSAPTLDVLPGSFASSGFLPFAAALAAMVVAIGCRHALGRSARMAFLLSASFLSGVAAAVALLLALRGNAVCAAAMADGVDTWLFRPGLAFALHLVGGTVALYAAFERGWTRAMPAAIIGLAGNAAGAFAFSSPLDAVEAAGVCLVVFLWVFFCAWRTLRGTNDFRLLVVFAVSVALGGLLAAATMPDAAVEAKLAAVTECDFLPSKFMEARRVLSSAAFKAWATQPWTGVGVGAFRFSLRLHFTPADWAVLPRGAVAVPNGWWQLLVERGIVGALLFALPLGLLAYAYLKRFVAGCAARTMPGPSVLLAPLALALAAASALFGCSQLRADVLVALGAMLAVSAKSFPRKG